MIVRTLIDHRRRGFTLIEVLLAMAVAAFVLVAIGGVFFGALQLRNRTTLALEQALPLQRALQVIERDLAGLLPPGGPLAGSLQTSAVLGIERDQVSPWFHTANATLEEGTPWGDIQRVAYLLVESTNNAHGRDLYRSATRNLLDPEVEVGVQEWLLSGVEDVAFEFYDGTQWRTYWDSSTEDPPMPRAVKVELQLAAVDGRRDLPPPMELIVPLWIDGRTNTVAQTTVTP